jgi:hypothetical protein
MATNINRNLPGDVYDAATTSLSHPSATNAFATMLDLANINNPGNANLLISGGASWSGTGMVFNVSALVYQIAGVEFSALAQNITLSSGDPSNNRFDAIVVNEAGVVSVILGTPAVNPLTPAIDENYVLVQYVLVGAGATTPTITNEFVYREGSSPDWLQQFTAGAVPSLSAVFTSTTFPPFQGLESTLVTAPSYPNSYNLKFVRYTKPSGSISRSTFTFLTFRVYLPVALPARNILVALYNNTTLIGAVNATNWGLGMNSINNWQLVSIPTNAFGNLGITTITSVRFLMTGATANTFAPGFDRYALDDIKFQSGFGPQINTATIDILDNTIPVGSTSKLNFNSGNGLIVTSINNTISNQIDLSFEATGQIQIYNNGTDTGLTLNETLRNFLIVQDVNISGDIVLPTNFTSPIAIGSVFKITNIGSTVVYVIPSSGVILNSRSSLNGIDSPYGVVTLTKIGTNSWLLEGDLV